MLCVDALMNKSIENYNSRHDLDTVQNVILYIYIYIYTVVVRIIGTLGKYNQLRLFK